jgi:hypothetical protein
VLENQEAPEQPSSAESEVQQIAVINCKNCASKAAQIGSLPTSSRHKLTQSMWLATSSLSFPFAFDQVPVAHLQVAYGSVLAASVWPGQRPACTAPRDARVTKAPMMKERIALFTGMIVSAGDTLMTDYVYRRQLLSHNPAGWVLQTPLYTAGFKGLHNGNKGVQREICLGTLPLQCKVSSEVRCHQTHV